MKKEYKTNKNHFNKKLPHIYHPEIFLNSIIIRKTFKTQKKR